jgi:large subunit ribosomal protein L18
MATKIRKRTSVRQQIRFKRKKRIRSILEGTSERPRLAVFRSNKHLYAQLIDDQSGSTLVSASTQESEFRADHGASVDGAKLVGSTIAKRALTKSIKNIVFDRSGYLYHGRVKALADAARESGLQF